jgi:hypothetical protein
MMAFFHKRENAEIEPIHCRLDSLEKRACDIEKHLQSRDPDTRAPANDRLDELERRAYELEKQVKKQQIHALQSPQVELLTFYLLNFWKSSSLHLSWHMLQGAEYHLVFLKNVEPKKMFSRWWCHTFWRKGFSV